MEVALHLIGGLALLLFGGEILLRGTERIAAALGMPHYLIALTVIAFGSSAPELVVSLEAANAGWSGIVLGNVLGSNLANIGLVVGLCALLRSLSVEPRLRRLEVPLVLCLQVLLFWIVLGDNRISRGEGLLLCGTGAVYLAWVIRDARRLRRATPRAERMEPAAVVVAMVLSLLGLVMLPLGADVFLTGAKELGESLGFSDVFIGLTIVALGTSLPELATSLLAVRKGSHSVAIGTVLGSNLFNLVVVLGAACSVFPIDIPGSERTHIRADLIATLIVSLALAIVVLRRPDVRRGAGLLLLLLYAGVIGVRSVMMVTGH